MAVAALELAVGTRISWRVVGFLGVAHVMVIWWAVKLGGGLCVGRRLEGGWGWDETDIL